MTCVPVFTYHHVNPNKGDMITVTPEGFGAQMRYLKEAGFTTLGMNELQDYAEGKSEVREKSVMITFDDGYLDNFVYAYPHLRANGIKATVFAVTGWMDAASNQSEEKKLSGLDELKKRPPTHNYCKSLIAEGLFHRAVMNWDMAVEMHGTGLVEFHSHTATHALCDAITKDDLARELELSKETVELNIGRPCSALCWPKGRFNALAVETAKEAGYRGVFTTVHGVVKKGSGPFAIKRIDVKEGLSWFKSRLKIYTNPLMAEIYSKMKGL
ncbi:MAG: polysaccharide deacetylase family protein [Deltaproteobacteria bacterium]|nr:polysaccharide deacetylase family protein [Deltaproteobacteria bacterium]